MIFLAYHISPVLSRSPSFFSSFSSSCLSDRNAARDWASDVVLHRRCRLSLASTFRRQSRGLRTIFGDTGTALQSSPETLSNVSNRRVRDRHFYLISGKLQFHHSGPHGDARDHCERWKQRTFNNEIDFACTQSLNAMKVDNIKLQKIISSSGIG